MERNLTRFVRVQFIDDKNVKENLYWYVSNIEVSIGDRVVAPLGRHNRHQIGIVRQIMYESDYNAPFPMYLIKYVERLAKEGEKFVQDNQ